MAKILIVDDSETLRVQLKKELQVGGHEILEAENGLVGLQQLEKNDGIQLIMCDVNMPEMDGLTMITKVHESEKHNKIPIFMLTTESSAEMKEKGKANGVLAWITKPFTGAKVLAAIEKVLAR